MNIISKKVIQDSLAQRSQYRLPSLSLFIGCVIGFMIVFMTVGWLIGPENRKDFHFVEEDGGLTALSAIFFSLAGGFAGIAFFLSRKRKDFQRFFWLLACGVFLFFAVDELLGFHEGVGWLADRAVEAPGNFRNWNDILVIGYGVVAVGVGIYFLPEIFRYPKLIEMLGIAFAFYFLHTLIDSLSEPRTLMSGIMEESSKLVCAAFLSLSMLVGLLSIISKIEKRKT